MSSSRTPDRSANRRTARLGLLLAVLAGPVCLLAAGRLDATDAAPPARQTLAAPGPEQLAHGRELYGQSCASCHGQDGGGSQRGPSLRDAGAASAHFQLSTGRMPLESPEQQPERGEPAFSPADINALVAYVDSVGTGPPIPSVSAGDLQEGRRLYLLNCAACHSSSGFGGALPNGQYAPSLDPATPTQLAEAIRVGPGAMPRFPLGTLSDTELNSIVTYANQLKADKAKGGHPLGGIGPVAEGAVAWIFGVGLLLLVVRWLGRRSR